jgi:hypothetical protein
MFTAEYVSSWFFAFAFTQIVEIPIYRRFFRCSVLRAFGATALTHPVVWFVIFPRWDASYLVKSVGAEVFAWWMEAAYFAWTAGFRNAITGAFVANCASVGLGLLSRYLFGAP